MAETTTITLITPEEDQLLSLQTDRQRQFFKNEAERAAIAGERTYYPHALFYDAEECTHPKKVMFSWDGTVENPEGPIDTAPFALLLGKDPSMEVFDAYCSFERSMEIGNLEIGTDYYWCIQWRGFRSEIRHFKTEREFPRCIEIDHVTNVRDIGGQKADGGYVRQGMIYRCAAIEDISKQGIEDFLRLKVRTELDLRRERVGVPYCTLSPYGVRRELIVFEGYEPIFEEKHTENIQKIFALLADPSAYPLFFHCAGGNDRTGTLAYFIEAILGVSEQGLIDDYEFSGMSVGGCRSRNYDLLCRMIDGLRALGGDTMGENVCRFLRSRGVPQEHLDSLRSIMLEPAAEDAETKK